MTAGQDVKVPVSLMAVSKVGRVRGAASVLRTPVPPAAVSRTGSVCGTAGVLMGVSL